MKLDSRTALIEVRARAKLSQERLAQLLGVSFVSVNRWERGASDPSPAVARKIEELYQATTDVWGLSQLLASPPQVFSSRGLRRHTMQGDLWGIDTTESVSVGLSASPLPPLLSRITHERHFTAPTILTQMLGDHALATPTIAVPPVDGMSAGKNTYTYDAHTYHTKVPPQGIAELLKHYLPEGGLVLDPVAGSGMTGVAARATGYDSILSELSPAACFIASRFTASVVAQAFEAGVRVALDDLRALRAELYTTTCRECGKPTELLYTVWSYNVLCSECGHEFLLWDSCRRYGRRVRDHKILTEFACPACHKLLRKRQLKRTIAEPVLVGYMCCGSRQQEVTHPPNQDDLELIYRLQLAPPVADGYYPCNELPDGVNLRQPKHHGIRRLDQFYTPRNLAAMSRLWRAIHRVEDVEIAAQLAFVFTSLYQRVTRLSEFRFWGGSGNTARFNVPFIFNEANVFVTFERKVRTIQDHLETTASQYSGRVAVIQSSATSLDFLPDASVDLIFTDPPFGANINYSEMNILWESWLQRFTDAANEAIINNVQGKGVAEYQCLMTASLRECYRVLRPGHWMLLVFMNSSSQVWEALRSAITEVGFDIRKADIFDKQHGTFKQFVSENTAGCDLVLHCFKPDKRMFSVDSQAREGAAGGTTTRDSIAAYLRSVNFAEQRNVFLHVAREAEIDFRKLYSEWMARAVLEGVAPLDFSDFRALAIEWLMANA